MRHPGSLYTPNRLDPEGKFDIHPGRVWFNGEPIEVKAVTGEHHLTLGDEDYTRIVCAETI